MEVVYRALTGTKLEKIFTSESPFRGLIDEDGYLVCTPGLYFYDMEHHQFFFGGKIFFNAIRNFIDKNPKEISEIISCSNVI